MPAHSPLAKGRCIDLILPDLTGGGAERVAIELARGFANAGYAVRFLLMRAEGDLLPAVTGRFEVVDLAAPRARHVLPSLIAHLRRDPPDALLASMWPLTVIAAVAARLSLCRCRVLVSEHNCLSRQYRDRSRLHHLAMRTSMALGYRAADAVIGVSEGITHDLAALSGLPAARFTSIHNPVQPKACALVCTESDVDALWAGSGPRILTVGSLKAQKNHALLLKAFAALPRPDSRLMLLGQGSLEAGLRAEASALGIADRVVFAGFHPDPAPFYASADLFVLASDYEGFANVIVEALDFGLPVVSTDCPSGPAEILKEGRFGRLVPVGDAPALAQAMDGALAAPPDPVGQRARAADFTPEVAVRNYLRLMEK